MKIIIAKNYNQEIKECENNKLKIQRNEQIIQDNQKIINFKEFESLYKKFFNKQKLHSATLAQLKRNIENCDKDDEEFKAEIIKIMEAYKFVTKNKDHKAIKNDPYEVFTSVKLLKTHNKLSDNEVFDFENLDNIKLSIEENETIEILLVGHSTDFKIDNKLNVEIFQKLVDKFPNNDIKIKLYACNMLNIVKEFVEQFKANEQIFKFAENRFFKLAENKSLEILAIQDSLHPNPIYNITNPNPTIIQTIPILPRLENFFNQNSTEEEIERYVKKFKDKYNENMDFNNDSYMFETSKIEGREKLKPAKQANDPTVSIESLQTNSTDFEQMATLFKENKLDEIQI